jgi:hypothetical protein
MTKHSKPADAYHPWRTYIDAREEARRRGDRKVGTEHLILGLLREPLLAQALGCDLQTARDALDAIDQDALAAVGIGASVQRTTDTDRRADQTSVEADVQSRVAGPFANDTRSQEGAGGIVQRDTPGSPHRPATGAVSMRGEHMDLMSIGEFARRSRLSAKAIRLYDELGLLPPAQADAAWAS